MATTSLEVIRGLAQAAANAYDGALDESGDPIQVGLKREEGHPVLDSRVMDGFKVKFHGNKLKILYHSDVKLKEVHKSGFEDEVGQMFGQVVKYLKKEYKNITGNTVTLTKEGDHDILVQYASKVRSWIQANCDYTIGGVSDVEPVGEASEELLDSSIKSWLAIGKDKYPNAKKPSNVTRKGQQ